MFVPTELEDELRELRREIVESRSLIIKTNNLTNTLSADLKAITRRQQSSERRISWNSATAYLVFVVVVLLFVKVAWDYRVESGRSELEGAKSEVEQLRKKNKELQAQTDTKSRVESKGQVLYDLMRTGKRMEFLEQFDSNVKETLSRTELLVFSDVAERYRNELAFERYTMGRDHLAKALFQEASASFEDSLRIKPDSSVAPSARLALAQCYRKLNRGRDAVPILQALMDSATDRDIQADSAWEMCRVQADLKAWNDAKNFLRAFIKKYPDSAHKIDAMQELAELQLRY
jgi:TolA-binding protein